MANAVKSISKNSRLLSKIQTHIFVSLVKSSEYILQSIVQCIISFIKLSI